MLHQKIGTIYRKPRLDVFDERADSAIRLWLQGYMQTEELNETLYLFLRGNEIRVQVLLELPSPLICTINPRLSAKIDAIVRDLREATRRIDPPRGSRPQSIQIANKVLKLRARILGKIDSLEGMLIFGRLLRRAADNIVLLREESCGEIRDRLIEEVLTLKADLSTLVCPKVFRKAWCELSEEYCPMLGSLLTSGKRK